MSCGRTNGARPSWVGSVLNWVQVLTFPWVLIRISIVNRVAAGPSGARPEGAAGQVWDALAAVAGVASRPAIRSSANTTAAATSEIARRARPDALPRWFVTTPAIFGRGRQANGASPTNTRSLLQLCRDFRRGGSSRTCRTPRSPRAGHPRSVSSSRAWLTPPIDGEKIIAAGMRPAIEAASWSAPLGSSKAVPVTSSQAVRADSTSPGSKAIGSILQISSSLVSQPRSVAASADRFAGRRRSSAPGRRRRGGGGPPASRRSRRQP